MTNNKAREINSPIIEELLDETTAEELAKIDTEMTNNKQQTEMKLYTEEEIKRGLDNPISFDMTTDEFINSLTPIELPSNEEIEQSSLKWFMTANKHEIIFDLGWMKIFEAGAKYAINKIQGGEQ
jgi:hypothetical protein